jgi:hypothetical protein
VRDLPERVIADQPQPPAQICLELAQSCWHLGDKEAADAAARRALAADPTLADAVLVRAWVAADRGDGEAALSCYRRLVELSPGAVRWRLKLVQLLNWSGRVAEAVSELERVNKLWPDEPMVRMFVRNYGPASALAAVPPGAAGDHDDPGHDDEAELRALADAAPGPAAWRRPLVDADPERDVLVADAAAATAVLVFTGSNDAVSMPLALFDRYLAPLPITTIYLKDFRRLRFLRGVGSLGEDMPATLAGVRRLLDRRGVKHLCAIGNCDGGFAAIRYGVELGAARILAFGAPTYSPPEFSAAPDQVRNLVRNRLAAAVAADMLDLRPFLDSRPHRSLIELFYEAEDPWDRAHAEHLAGAPGVRLQPRPGLSNHHLLRRLALASEDFCATLATLLAVSGEEHVAAPA